MTEKLRPNEIELFKNLEMVEIPGGEVVLGTESPLRCTLEGRRWNETPVRSTEVEAFRISKFKITNAVWESLMPGHIRCPQSLEDDMPVVEVMYGEVLTFCKTLSELTGMGFRLPTETEWMLATAPSGWEYSYQEGAKNPQIDKGHVHGDGHEHGAVRVGDSRWGLNHNGLDQMGHNVSEFVFGHHRISEGTNGAVDDGMYAIAKGGNYGHCPYTSGVNRRIIVDVADRNTRIGFRLAL